VVSQVFPMREEQLEKLIAADGDDSFLIARLSLALVSLGDQLGLMHPPATHQAIRRDIFVILLGAHSLLLCCSLFRRRCSFSFVKRAFTSGSANTGGPS